MDPRGGTCHCSPSYLIRSIPPVEGLENNAKKQCGVGPVVDGDPIGPRQLIVLLKRNPQTSISDEPDVNSHTAYTVPLFAKDRTLY